MYSGPAERGEARGSDGQAHGIVSDHSCPSSAPRRGGGISTSGARFANSVSQDLLLFPGLGASRGSLRAPPRCP